MSELFWDDNVHSKSENHKLQIKTINFHHDRYGRFKIYASEALARSQITIRWNSWLLFMAEAETVQSIKKIYEIGRKCCRDASLLQDCVGNFSLNESGSNGKFDVDFLRFKSNLRLEWNQLVKIAKIAHIVTVFLSLHSTSPLQLLSTPLTRRQTIDQITISW